MNYKGFKRTPAFLMIRAPTCIRRAYLTDASPCNNAKGQPRPDPFTNIAMRRRLVHPNFTGVDKPIPRLGPIPGRVATSQAALWQAPTCARARSSGYSPPSGRVHSSGQQQRASRREGNSSHPPHLSVLQPVMAASTLVAISIDRRINRWPSVRWEADGRVVVLDGVLDADDVDGGSGAVAVLLVPAEEVGVLAASGVIQPGVHR